MRALCLAAFAKPAVCFPLLSSMLPCVFLVGGVNWCSLGTRAVPLGHLRAVYLSIYWSIQNNAICLVGPVHNYSRFTPNIQALNQLLTPLTNTPHESNYVFCLFLFNNFAHFG